LFNDNLEEYEDPILYDTENDPHQSDIPLLIKWAQQTTGPILDIACGTGRATIPLARLGRPTVGVDLHQGMLDQAKLKSDKLDLPIEWLQQDCTKLNLPTKSSFVYMVGNAFQHFHTNESQNALLTSIHRHMNEEGIFIFETRFPSAEELLQPAIESYWRTYQDPISHLQVDLYTISEYDALRQIQHYTTIRKYVDDRKQLVKENKTHISLRYVYPQEMERILQYNGFAIVAIYKNWNEAPIDNDSYSMIYICKKVSS